MSTSVKFCESAAVDSIRLKLYPFRFRDPVTGRWIKARHVASKEVIAASHAEFEITGPPEIREGSAGMFKPWKVIPHAELMRITEPAPELQPHLAHPPAVDGVEAFLAGVFLRRYVTYCARRGYYARMNGAARLLATLRPLSQPPRRARYPMVEAT